jgi:hypothetical protein
MIDTSKLLERFDFFRLVRRSSGLRRLLDDLCADDAANDDGAIGDGTSLVVRFISVAEEANEESKEMRSVLVHTMPTFLEGVTHGESMLGFSDARRCDDACGIGVSVVDTKSENRLFE